MSKFKRYERYKDSGVEWIGEIPEHWEITKLKYICSESAVYGLNESAENYVEEGVRFIRTTDIDNKGNLDNSMGGVFLPEEKVKGYILKTGDLLVSRSGSLGTSLYFDEDKYGKCSYAGYLVKFRANSKNCPKFLFYFSKSNIFYIQIQLALVSSTISNFNGNKYANMILPLPSYYEQKAISNFLDQKTAEIDGLIADKEKLIELLQEKRQAIITEAVTKGLNPNVRMKDSGIEWIGEIPEHWRIVRLKFLKTSPFQYGANEPAEMDDPQLPRYIRITDINEKGDLREDTFKSLSWESAQPYLLKDGDILFARSGATVGKTFMYRGELGPACYAGYLIRFKPDKSKVNSYYIYYYTLSKVYEEWIKQNIIQATIQNVSAEKYGNLQVPLPPLEEQKGIVKYLNDKIEEIDILVESIYVQIQKLKEYRQSLISEAVTGKIDVRDYDVSN